VLAAADEIVVIGYSMPPYDYDFRTLFVSSLIGNERRKRIVLKIVTKGTRHQKGALRSQLGRFVGSVEILGSDGLLDYLKRQGYVD
jgi:hypothetical protein